MNLKISNLTEYSQNTDENFISENKKLMDYLSSISDQNEYLCEFAPIFIVGFPRSGTTLLDRMLNKHPELCVIEEKNILETVIYRSMEKTERMSNIRRRYKDAFLSFRNSKSNSLLIDKHPMNIRFLPFLQKIFPNSKTIVMMRNPIECIFSCYRTSFEMNPAMSLMQSLDDLVELYGVSFSSDVISRFEDPDVMVIKYETLTEDTRTTLQEVMKFLEKPFWQEQLDFHDLQNIKGVRTPSFNQVNRPIYYSSLEYAGIYKKQLKPWLIKLSPFIERFGYEHA
jgi:hypothetical protein